MPDIRLKQSARFTDATGVQVSVPDVFADWVSPGFIEAPAGAPLVPAYEVTIDWRTAGGTLDESQVLATAVMVALGSDRLAAIDDELPDTLSTDRRGWWGDLDAEQIWSGWPIGTRLWEMRRDAIRGPGYRHGATTIKADDFIREAMQPFVQAGIISRFSVEVEQVTSERIDALITLYRARAPAILLRYHYLWEEIGRNVA